MNSTISKEVKILSIAFLFIFLGFNGAQQYLTAYFSEIKLLNVGFNSLVLIYLFFLIFEPLSAIIISKYGAKKCMVAGSLLYFLFIISLLNPSVITTYLTSVLLGIAASLLWTGQTSYLIRVSEEKSYGASTGFFSSFQSLGSAIGVFTFGILIARFLFKTSFLIFSFFPLLGLLLLLFLKDLKVKEEVKETKGLGLIKKLFLSKTALKLSIFGFSLQFIYGLVIGIIPIEINKFISLPFVGFLSSMFYILPIIFSYFLGRLSDISGRVKMIFISFYLVILGLIVLFFSSSAIYLIIGIFLIALYRSISFPLGLALIGDVSSKENIDFLTAFFWMFTGMGVVLALLISNLFQSAKIIYLTSIIIILISIKILIPLLRNGIQNIKTKIAEELM
jgi:MFS family permease